MLNKCSKQRPSKLGLDFHSAALLLRFSRFCRRYKTSSSFWWVLFLGFALVVESAHYKFQAS
jgi:hypothetical protein